MRANSTQRKKGDIYAPKEQQIEGLKFVLTMFSVAQIKRACYNLARDKFCSKSTYWKTMKNLRHAAGMTWEEFDKI